MKNKPIPPAPAPRRTKDMREIIASFADVMRQHPGAYMLHIGHDDRCPSLITHNDFDCTCREIEYSLVKVGGPKQ
jgi:hypothetical protein